MYERYFPVLRKAPFRHAKWPISGAEMHHIALWYGLNQTMKWALSESGTNFSGLCYGVHHNTVLSEISFIMYDLTFIKTSFPILICQNNVKKICKFLPWVFLQNTGIGCKWKHRKYLFLLRVWFIGCDSVNSSSCEQMSVIVYKSSCGEKFSFILWYFKNKKTGLTEFIIHPFHGCVGWQCVAIYTKKPEPSSREDGPGFLLNFACVLKTGTL